MGFFTDKCPSCGEKVRKGASFCPHCGAQAPKAAAACPSCGEKVRGGARFCPHCGAAIQAPGTEETGVDEMNRWARAGGEFARRIEARDLRGLLQRGLVVEPGTKALIFQSGSLASVVGPGAYDLNRKLGDADAAAPATAILVDAGELSVPISYRDLRTADDLPVDASVEVVTRLGDAANLHANLMHGRESLPTSALADLVRAESANVLQAHIKRHAAGDLYGNLDLVKSLEGDLQERIGRALARNGLELVRLRFLEFHGEAYDRVRGARGKTAAAEATATEAERRAAVNRRIRETLTQDKMDRIGSADELQDFIRQQEHELGMKNVVRQEEIEELKRVFEQKKLDARRATEMLEAYHETELLAERLKQRSTVTEAGIAEKRKRMDLAFEARRSKDQIDLDRKRQEQVLAEQAREAEARRERERMEVLNKAEQQHLAADLKKTELMKDMSEEQILAMVAKDSPEAAQAIAERYKAQAQTASSEEVKHIYEKMFDRVERMHKESLEGQAHVAAGRIGAEREKAGIVEQMADKAVDRMADVAAAKAGAGGTSRTACPECRSEIEPGAKFCEHCGRQLRE